LPLFFFAIGRGSTLIEDEGGTTCQDIVGAREHALEVIRELRRSGDFDAGDWRMIVSDQNGRQLFELAFADS
jgi:hypothetical protein